MPMMKRFKSPVLFDANILMNFKGQLYFLCNFFESILIHKKVLEEVLDESVKNEINLIMKKQGNILLVDDVVLEDEIDKTLYKECDRELRSYFNIRNLKDLGEYKTLLYAKFNRIKLLSSQDTTVWRFLTESTYFNDIECITMQDISYLIYLNGDKKGRRLAKSLYNHFSRDEHTFNDFKSYMKRHGDEIPKYIEFENNRIENFNLLVEGYLDFYSTDIICGVEEIEREIIQAAKNNSDTCISCLYSRINCENVDYLIRICSKNYKLFDEDCTSRREEFSKNIKRRK